MTGAGEGQLLDRFLEEGDEEAFEAILRRHGPMVLGVCRRILADPHDAEDAFQATFLVLVRKAGSIGDRAVLGPWLHGVARRVAVRARVNARRRRAREREGFDMADCRDGRRGEGDAAELRTILDQEVARLGERYRSALVLCDLEGHTHEQAAARLRCPVGTVKSRLSRARETLRARLARRGIVPSAGLLAATLAAEPASALTADLLGSTLRAATRLSAGRTIAAGTVSAAVTSLAEQTSRSMSMSIVKFAAAVLTAGLIAAGAGVSAYQAPGKKQAGVAIDPRTKKAETQAGTTTETGVELPGPAPGAGKSAPVAESSQTVASLAQARYQQAARMLEYAWAGYKLNPNPLFREPVHSWALRVLEARRDLGDMKADRIAAAEDYLKVWQATEKVVKPEDKNELAVVRYYRTEAELWLAQARAGKEPRPPGPAPGDRPGPNPGGRPGSDPRSHALLARLEETIPMRFSPNPTPLEEVLKYIRQATAGPDREGIPIYVDPIDPSAVDEEPRSRYEQLMKTPISMDLEGVPLRRVLKLIAEQLNMGYGIKDGMVTFAVPNMVRRNWNELLVMEESFPMSSPLELEVERARRGELTTAELDQLNERLRAIEEVTKRAISIRRPGMPGMQGGMMRAMPGPAPGPQTKPQ
jgi:RNA polymerase sigma factor (sigma-70 family)